MSELNKHLLIDIKDSANNNCKIFGAVRISVLTSKMIRIEVSESGNFNDLPTQKVWHRAFDIVQYDIADMGKYIEVKTASIAAKISKDGKLKSVLLQDGRNVTNFESGNLKGTCRTLDGTIGAVKLEDGVISKNGVAILDDSDSLVFDNQGKLSEKTAKNRDYYIFAYGYDYRQAIIDLYKLTGETQLLPRYVLGNWWSRYRAYTQQEYLKVMDDFAQKNIPITVATVDMDWHLVNDIDKKYRTGSIYPWESTGWTGYTWNEKLFPDYKQFLKDLHNRNLRVTLNLHPARGVRGFEVMYKEMAEAVGVDYTKEEPVEFDLTNEKFVNSYFDILHHPYEKDGVDFWWIDWQQGKKSQMQGLDPLYALNHYHTLDNSRDNKRGVILSRYAGVGSHRYPLGFSGDTNTSWECLKFQPYFTANATNCGYSWWSHDIGGHHFGVKDDELYCRWIQFGVFSPIMRLHSTQNDIMGKEPWNYSGITEEIASRYMRLRHSLIPYLYTMNMRTHKEGIALIEPVYYDYPTDERAYKCKNNYMFGSNLLVAPVTEKTDKRTLTAPSQVFLPKGIWTDIFTGKEYIGDNIFEVNRNLGDMPVFAKQGAIIPLAENCGVLNNCENPKILRLLVFKGNGDFTLYEDDGESLDYKKGVCAQRKFAVSETEQDLTFEINPVNGDLTVCTQRKFIVDFKNIESCDKIVALLNDKPVDITALYTANSASNVDLKNNCLECEINLKPTDSFVVKLCNYKQKSTGSLNENIVRIFAKYQFKNTTKSLIYNNFKMVETKQDLQKSLSKLATSIIHKRLYSWLKELLYMSFDD